jgi:penicillin-binding protein 2
MKPLVPALFFAALGAPVALRAQEAEALAPPKAEVVEEPGEEMAPEVRPAESAEQPAEAPKARVVPEEGTPEAEMPPEEEKPEEAKEVRAVPADPKNTAPPVIREMKPDKPRISMTTKTDPNAKPLSLRVPAPRGLIVDRNGKPLAQNRMAHYIGVQLPLREGMKEVEVLDFARGPLAFCQGQLPGGWEVSDADIIMHYKKRRWVPLMSAALVPEDKAQKLKDNVPPGVVLRPIFLRTYPEGKMAGHLMGQMGKSGGFAPPKQDLEGDETMWPATVGRAGLEKRFDTELTGKPGHYTALYDAKGEKLTDEWVERPTAGHTVVTTLDMDMQKICERNLRERGVRGAFVVMDVKTGDIVAMASTPSIDPNEWSYGISEKRQAEILNDKDNPMYCKAIQGLYPPASTFKIVTALAALETDEVGPNSYFSCPPGMRFDGRWIKNHTSRHEGDMDVERAIARSCNTWFFQAAKACGGGALSTMASRFGYGERTGICLTDMEKAGFMPTPETYAKKKGSMTSGILAITSIGQGEVLATPLQVCQMMAGVARGDAVPRPRLVKMIQDVDGRVVQHFPPSVRNQLTLEKENLEAVRRGMREVVSGGGGTGSRAENHYVPIAGKTGTGEWSNDKSHYVAWFAGFIPYKNPEFAYACLYEGEEGESQISGGRKVAPIVGDVFNEIYKAKQKRGDLDKEDKADDDESLASSRRERNSTGEDENTVTAPAATPAAAPEPQRRGLRWIFRRRDTPQGGAPAAPPPSRFGR